MTATHLGMNRETGRAITDGDHLRQSIADIVWTVIGSRIERRPYGSQLPTLIDQPLNQGARLRITAAIVGALVRWEPRVKLRRVTITLGDAPGRATIDMEGELADTGLPLTLSLPLAPRQSYSPDGSLLASAAADDYLLVDGSNWLRRAA